MEDARLRSRAEQRGFGQQHLRVTGEIGECVHPLVLKRNPVGAQIPILEQVPANPKGARHGNRLGVVEAAIAEQHQVRDTVFAHQAGDELAPIPRAPAIRHSLAGPEHPLRSAKMHLEDARAAAFQRAGKAPMELRGGPLKHQDHTAMRILTGREAVVRRRRLRRRL